MEAGGDASGKAYLDGVLPLIHALADGSAYTNIVQGGKAVARSLHTGNTVWIAQTTHCLHLEATYRAGGLMGVHTLSDTVLVRDGDCVIEGSPVGTSSLAIDTALDAKVRGATLIALTNVDFENHNDTILEHSSGRRLHEIADIVVDLGGPLGDGVFIDPRSQIAVMPYSGVTGMVAMWMMFSEAICQLNATGSAPRFWQCIMVKRASEHNRLTRAGYLATSTAVV